MSRVSQAVGQAFENYIELTAEMMGWVLLKQHPPVLRRGRRVVVVGRAAPDFVLFFPNGVAMIFDAKSVAGKVFRAPADRYHQFAQMQLIAGRVPWVRTGYLIEWRHDDVSYQFAPISLSSPWPVVVRFQERETMEKLEDLLKKIGENPDFPRKNS